MRVLLVEDSEVLRRTVRRALKHAGYAVDTAADGEEGFALAEMNDYDALILDIMLPKLDGLTLLQRLRAAGKNTHAMFLTARDTVEDRVNGLGQGADDYLVKPFALAELIARVGALCRRNYDAKNVSFRIGLLEINLSSRQVLKSGVTVDLTAREWRLLEYLIVRRGEVVPRSEIEAHIYDEFVEPMSNVVDTAIYSLRRKIGSDLIHTRRGLGYILEA
ncbi:MAG: response regulator transcription factor [Gloeobacteraceae cyanobacterium ES-bin-144]|nr:response regulator transcription factor [Verrucomicrobiales bacterium]